MSRLLKSSAALFHHLDNDGMPLQSCELFGKSGVIGREADAGIGGIGYAQVFSVAAVVAVVVRHDELFVVDGDADDVAEGESGLHHVSCREV